jgi:DNA-binding LytR/AlgR family response regulator
MKIAIIDDEPLAAEVLQSYLQRLDTVELVAVCTNALQAFALLSKQKVDLLLLDINMPEINGVDFLKTLKNPPLVIFTTAYTEYAVTSYELNAVDYLLKPVSFERFLKAINKASALLESASETVPVSSLSPNTVDRLMFVRSEGKWIKIDLAKVWFVEGLKDYVRIWMDEGRVTVHSTMKNFEEQLQPFNNYIRVHKSHIVNLDYVEEVDGSAIRIKGETVVIGSTYKDAVQKVFNGLKFL